MAWGWLRNSKNSAKNRGCGGYDDKPHTVGDHSAQSGGGTGCFVCRAGGWLWLQFKHKQLRASGVSQHTDAT